MKNLNLTYLLALLISLFTFQSCDDGEEIIVATNPEFSIETSQDVQTISMAEAMNLKINVYFKQHFFTVSNRYN